MRRKKKVLKKKRFFFSLKIFHTHRYYFWKVSQQLIIRIQIELVIRSENIFLGARKKIIFTLKWFFLFSDFNWSGEIFVGTKMNKIILFYLFFVLQCSMLESANILYLNGVPSKSHFLWFVILIQYINYRYFYILIFLGTKQL